MTESDSDSGPDDWDHAANGPLTVALGPTHATLNTVNCPARHRVMAHPHTRQPVRWNLADWDRSQRVQPLGFHVTF